MKKIYFRNNVLIYFGNPVGYRAEDKIIIDTMFDREDLKIYLLEKEGLEVVVKEGVYDRLSNQTPEMMAGDTAVEGGGEECSMHLELRIYQIKPDRPVLVRFISLEERERRGFGKPERWEYDQIYEGEVPSLDLEKIWDEFSRKELAGHSLSISDVVELADDGESRFFYIDRTCFKEIDF